MEKNHKDSRYKKYTQSVERALQSFDKEVNEWPDLIAFLGKLLKTFQTYAKEYNEIPLKLVVGKRLAQSLSRALPPGVHREALGVYECIFQSIGPERLAEDLAIYSQGLFPFLQYAKMSVKPQLLNIYEKYYLPLRGRLRPVLKAFITALLPGLEEEGNEFFDKVLSLLDFLEKTVEQSYFLQSMWLVLIVSPSLRSAALNYLSRRMPKITSQEDVAVVLGDDIGLMVRAFSATLGDKEILVQRAILDLLIANFPLKDKNVGEIMQQDDLILLMKSVTAIVLRKDMSLNRRIYAWLLGPDESSEQQVQYFQEYGKKAICAALKNLFFSNAKGLAVAQRPYKILISLMDKWEIGQPIVEEILVEILRSLKNHVQKSDYAAELLQTANMFLEMIHPYLIWMTLYGLFQDQFPICDGADITALDLVDFVLNSFKLHEEEIQQIHIPLFLLALLCKLQELANKPDFTNYISQIEAALQIGLDLFHQIPNAIFFDRGRVLGNRILGENVSLPVSSETPGSLESDTGHINFTSSMSPVKYISGFYRYGDENATSNEFESVRGLLLAEELLKAIQGFLHRILINSVLTEHQKSDKFGHWEMEIIIDRSCALLRAISHQLSGKKLRMIEMKESVDELDALIKRLYSGEWVHSLLKCSYMVNNFRIIDSALSTIVSLIMEEKLISPTLLDSKEQTRVIVDKLWSFLDSQHAAWHLRCTQLICLLQVSEAKYVETVIAEYLVQKDTSLRLIAYERFGIFWKLSDSFQKNGLIFLQPMFLMLDTLRDENPTNRRVGEAWMRRQHDSYHRLLDPMIVILIDSSIKRRVSEITINNEPFDIFYYQRPFNQTQISYLFETMLTVYRTAGNNFLKALRYVNTKLDLLTECEWLSREAPFLDSMTYTELIIRIALRYIETEMPDTLRSMGTMNDYIQIYATDLLNAILVKPEYVDPDLVFLVHDATLRKMVFCIRTRRLDLQARLLHLLLSTIMIIGSPSRTNSAINVRSSSPIPGFSNKKSSLTEPLLSELASRSQQSIHDVLAAKEEKDTSGYFQSFRITGTSSFLIKALIEALKTPSNRPLLQQWMNFVTVSLPCYRNYFNSILMPLLKCICEQVNRWRVEMLGHYENFVNEGATADLNTHTDQGVTSDWDINTLLNGLEKTLMFCLQDGISSSLDGKGESNVSSPSTAQADEAISGIGAPPLFSFDTATMDTSFPEQKPREYVLYYLFPNIVSILLDIYSIFKRVAEIRDQQKTKKDLLEMSFSHTRNNVISHLQKMFEKFCKSYRDELVETFVELWYLENSNTTDLEYNTSNANNTAIEVLQSIPGLSPQKVVTTLLDSARKRSSGSQTPSRTKKPLPKYGKLSDTLILKFLEVYFDSLHDINPLVEMWPQCLAYVKEVSSQASAYKYLLPSLLRFVTSLSEKLVTTSCFEDKKVRREMQEIYQKLVEYCIQIAGRSFDQFLWPRRQREDDDVSSLDINEEKDAEPIRSSTPLSDDKKNVWKSKEEQVIDQVNQLFARSIIPNLKRLLADQERINQVISNVMYYIIGPALKKQTSLSQVMLDILYEVSRIPTAYSKWRNQVWDFFIDNRFFNMSPAAIKKWRAIIQVVLTSEKERFSEVLGRISTSPANALFTSKDQELLNRALNLRRLSLILYCGKMDQYLPQLPDIHVKLVELMKLGLNEMVHAEIYLCLRILLCRISNQHLVNFWPGVLTELNRLFSIFQQDTLPEQAEEFNVLLAACKFLDLLFVLQTEEFQLYEWMFITDTIDVINRALAWSPYAQLDKLGEKLSGKKTTNLNNNLQIGYPIRAGSPLPLSFSPSDGEYKRPILTIRSIFNLQQLEFFAQQISLYVYQSTFTLAQPDVPYIENLLENDLLEGGDESHFTPAFNGA